MTDTDTDAADPDFATSDEVGWLIQLDRAALDEFRDGLAHCDYLTACARLLTHLAHTEHVRAGLLLEDGPAFGTGEAPDYDVAWQQTQITLNVERQRAALPDTTTTGLEELIAP